MGKSCKRKHDRKCKCKKCIVEYRHIKCVKSETKKQKYDVRISCNKCRDKCESDTGEWNAALIYPAGSGFVNIPNNKGRYSTVNGVVHATAAVATDGPGRAVPTDFARAILSLPVPAAQDGSFKGVILHVSAIPDGGKTVIVRSRLKLRDTTIAEIKSNDTIIATNSDIAPAVRPCYQVWIKVTYNCSGTCC